MATRPPPRGVHVALLRGINVGGKNRLPMEELVALFADLGCAEIRTYIQSGNVVFEADAALSARLPERVAKAIDARHGLRVPVVLRSAGELVEAARENPFLRRGEREEELHLAFLATTPGPDRVAALDPARSPGDELAVRGRDVYLRLPNGVARTKLTNAWLDTKLATTSTVRNWRTVMQLVEMTKR